MSATDVSRDEQGLLRRAWPLVGIGLLAALAVLEVGLDFTQRSHVATRKEWEAAAAAIRAEHRPGDLIVTAPRWADPLGRLAIGERMTLDDVTRPDAATYRNVFELSIRGARHPDTRGARVVWRRRFGRVTATRYARTPVRVATDFYAALPRAQVWEQRGSRRTATCPWDAGRQRFLCAARWKSVRAIRAEIGYQPHRCVFAHPIEGATRVIEYADVAPGDRLVVYTGIAGYDPRYRARRAVWEYQRWRAGKLRKKKPLRPVSAVPVTLTVQVDGKEVARLHHPIDDETWRRHVTRLPGAGPRKARVRFTVTTRYAWAKRFCFYARAEHTRGGAR